MVEVAHLMMDWRAMPGPLACSVVPRNRSRSRASAQSHQIFGIGLWSELTGSARPCSVRIGQSAAEAAELKGVKEPSQRRQRMHGSRPLLLPLDQVPLRSLRRPKGPSSLARPGHQTRQGKLLTSIDGVSSSLRGRVRLMGGS